MSTFLSATPNIDRIAKEGMMFTDYYAEQSCTAGRSTFITGQVVLRTGLSKVGLPGAKLGLQKEDMTLAEALKPLGYATGQFGKNHLGDRDEYLPTKQAGILRIVFSTRRRRDRSDDVTPMKVALAAVLLLVLAACQSPAPVAIPTASERALAAGIALYDAGNFNGAIKRLRGAREIWSDSTSPGATANKLAAHKYLAFSYCVTNRRALCRQQFVDAIKLEPNFDLAPAEKGHPLWGPEFDRARKQASAPAAPAGRPAQSAATPSRRSP